MTDYITSRGTVFYILVWVALWFTIEYGHRWFFEHFNIESNLLKFGSFLTIFIVLLSVTVLVPINGNNVGIPGVYM